MGSGGRRSGDRDLQPFRVGGFAFEWGGAAGGRVTGILKFSLRFFTLLLLSGVGRPEVG